MRTPSPFWLLAAAGALTACTAILNQSADQCSKDADCTAFGAEYTCNQGLCRGPGSGSGSSGNTSSGGSSGVIDADAAPADAGCVPTPNKTRNADFYNEKCTNATCIPFDNCARLGVCDGAALPALISPPDGGV